MNGEVETEFGSRRWASNSDEFVEQFMCRVCADTHLAYATASPGQTNSSNGSS